MAHPKWYDEPIIKWGNDGLDHPEYVFTPRLMDELEASVPMGGISLDILRGITGLLGAVRSQQIWAEARAERLQVLELENAALKTGKRADLRKRIAELEAKLGERK